MTEQQFVPLKGDVMKAIISAYQQVVQHGRGSVNVKFENAGSDKEKFSINVEYEIAFVRTERKTV